METSALFAAAKRRYEWARVVRSAMLAAIMIGVAALIARFAMPNAAWWPFPIAALLFAGLEYRGQAAMKGARRGYIAGLVLLAAPIALLRPCCIGMDTAAMGTNCCTMPSMCAGVGVAIGLALSLVRPRSGSRVEAAFGLWLGVASIASMRCTGLFIGEAFGLMAGLLAGVSVAVPLNRLAR